MVLPIAGGVGLATRKDGSPDSPSAPVEYFPDLIKSAGQTAWNDYRGKLQQILQDNLGKGDLISSGVTLYDIVLNVASDVSLGVERDENGDLVVHLTVGTTYIEATSTTPTALGSWADPRFSFAFGLDLIYRIDLPPTTQPLSGTGFESIHLLSPVLDSHNFVADVIFMIDDVQSWFSGTNFIALLEQFIASTDFAPYVNDALAPLNEKLTELAAAGYWFMQAIVDQLDGASSALHGLSLPGAPADRIDLLLTAYGFDLSGAIEGGISWPRALGAPSDQRGLFIPRNTSVAAVSLSAVAAALQVPDPGLVTTVRQDAPAAAAVSANQEAVAGVGAAAPVLATPMVDSPMASPVVATPIPATEVFATPVLAMAGADSSIAQALISMSADDRITAAGDLRAGVASRYISIVGASRFAEIQQQFLRGRDDFTVGATVTVAGDGPFGEQRPVGEMAYLWAADDDTNFRRNYRVVNIPIDTALTLTCQLAPTYQWHGSTDQVVCQQSGWDGAITVHPARALHLRDVVSATTQAQSALQAAQVAGNTGENSELLNPAHHIRIGDVVHRAADRVSLNPQPLPPGGDVSLNPQPIPPGSVRLSNALHTGLASSVISGASQEVNSPVLTEFNNEQAAQLQTPIIDLVRHQPEGNGTVRDINFNVVEYVAPVIR